MAQTQTATVPMSLAGSSPAVGQSVKVRSGSPTYGEELPNRPKNSANASATYRWPSRLTMAIAVRYVGPSFDDAITPTWLGGYVLSDLRVSFLLRDRLEIYGRVENLTDKHYETTYEYGTLGRAGTWEFGRRSDGNCGQLLALLRRSHTSEV